MWRDWFTFSRQDRRAIILLSVLLLIILGILCSRKENTNSHTLSATTDSIANTLYPKANKTPILKIERHTFDPNKADSMELLTMGLTPYVTRNILRYRRAGGIFRQPKDLARIYGMNDSTYAEIEPYITIPQEKRAHKPTPIKAGTPQTRPNEAPKEHPYTNYMQAKHKPGTFVDLNTADTTELMKIPGIGRVYAKMIVDYREELGGYHSITQLRELHGLPEDLGDWVHISTPVIKRLPINKLSITHLRSHPYLTFYQAKAIVELRRREGDIRSKQQLLFLDEFTEADIERLTPYLSFD